MRELGLVLKPQGVKGELKIRSFTDCAEVLLSLKEVFFADVAYKVEHIRIAGSFAFMKLASVDSMSMAERFRGLVFSVPKDKVPVLPKGRYFVEDVIGLNVNDENGFNLGTIVDVLQNGSADVYVVSGQRSFMFPALRSVVKNISVEDGIVAVDTKELQTVAVYED